MQDDFEELKKRTPSLDQMNQPNYNRTRAGRTQDPEKALDPNTPYDQAADKGHIVPDIRPEDQSSGQSELTIRH